MRLTLEIDAAVRPLQGWLDSGHGGRVAFVGLLELLSLLEAQMSAAADDGPGSAA